MSTAIAVKKSPDGSILARRLDGQPLTEADRAEARALAELQVVPEAARAWVVEEYRTEGGALAAVKILSAMLEDHLFLVFEPEQFIAPAGAATYSPAELVALRDKDPATIIKTHHGTKTGKHGGKVLQ